MPVSQRDKFIISITDPNDASIEIRQIKLLRKALTIEYLQKYAPPGSTVIGLIDSEGKKNDEVDTQTIPQGSYKILYESEDDYLNATATKPEDIAQCFLATNSFSNKDKFDEILRSTLVDRKHDIVAYAIGNIQTNFILKSNGSKNSTWSYLLALTDDSVIVTIDCDQFECEFLDFTKVTEFSSNCGQGEGSLHPLAYYFAQLLPFKTLLSLCAPNMDIFDWNIIKKYKNKEPTRRKLIFTGKYVSGMVAHVAALLAREISLQGQSNIEVRAVTFSSPHCISIGITTALAKKELHKQHLTFFHENDVRLRLFQVAFDVQVAKIIGQDCIFDSTRLITEMKTLFNHSNDKNAWESINSSLKRGAIDMLDTHSMRIEIFKFVPIGIFGKEKISGKKSASIKTTDILYTIQEWIEGIPMNFNRIEWQHLSEKLFTQTAKFELLDPGNTDIQIISNDLRPTVKQCSVQMIASQNENVPNQTNIVVQGCNLENIIQRNNTSGVSLSFKEVPSASQSPILFHDMKSVDIDSGCSVIVTSTSLNEASFTLQATSFRSDHVKLSIFNDFGESKSFKTGSIEAVEGKDLKLQMFTTLNEDILITTFLRSMMMIHCIPQLYLKTILKSSSSNEDDSMDSIEDQEKLKLKLMSRPSSVPKSIPFQDIPLFHHFKESKTKNQSLSVSPEHSPIQDKNNNEKSSSLTSQSSKFIPAKINSNSTPSVSQNQQFSSDPIKIGKRSSLDVNTQSNNEIPRPNITITPSTPNQDHQVAGYCATPSPPRNSQYIKVLNEENIPGALQLLFEVECLILEKEKSELKSIAIDFCDKQKELPYAVTKARKVIDKIVAMLMTPFKLKYDNIVQKVVKQIARGIGIVTGGAITVFGGVLAVPGLLLFAGDMIRRPDSFSDSFSILNTSGLVLALPGLGVGAVGYWLLERSLSATKDKSSMQYAQILKLLLNILYDDSNQVFHEVPSLEDRVTKQARKTIGNFAFMNDKEYLIATNLWDISDDDLDFVLTENDTIPEGVKSAKKRERYKSANATSRKAIRKWMRVSGKIHRIRNLMESHLVIGFVGVHNAGKSTWINTLFDLGVKADSIERTESVDLLPLYVDKNELNQKKWKNSNSSALQLSVVDYPGSSDQRDMVAQMAERLSNVTTLFVCVFRFGHIARPEKDVIDMVKRTNRDYVVLINQCDIARDLDTREQQYRANYAGVLEIDESRLHFVSCYDPLRAEYVRHLLWAHLQILVTENEDRIELAMKLLDSKSKSLIIENNKFDCLYKTLVVPFERGTESNYSILDDDDDDNQSNLEDYEFNFHTTQSQNSNFCVPDSPIILMIHNEVYDWLIEIGISEKEIDTVYRCLFAYFSSDKQSSQSSQSQSAQSNSSNEYLEKSSRRNTLINLNFSGSLDWAAKELLELYYILPKHSNSENLSQSENTLIWSMFSITSTISTVIQSVSSETKISNESVILTLENLLKNRPKEIDYENLKELSIKTSQSMKEENQNHQNTKTTTNNRTTIFRRKDLINNLAISTRFQPVPKIANTAFVEYKGFSGHTMPLLNRLHLFRKRVIKQKKRFKHDHSLFRNTPVIALKDSTDEICDMITSSVYSISNTDLYAENYEFKHMDVTEFMNLAAISYLASMFIEYEGGAYFNPVISDHSTIHMQAIGRLVGISLQKKIIFPLKFSYTIFKLILGLPISFSDLENLSPSLCKKIKYLCQLHPDDLYSHKITFVDSIGLDETVNNGNNTLSPSSTHEYELVKDGSLIPVSSANLTDYLRKLVLHRLCRHLPLEYFVLGVQDVIPRNNLCLFSPQMLQVMVNGIPPPFDVSDLQKNYIVTKDSLSPSPNIITWFWECISEMGDEDRALFLIFITGKSQLPPSGLKPNFTIKSVRGSLPTSNTANHVLQLPNFTSKEQLNNNLLLAIRNNSKV